jgi:hypothetical protein
MPYNKKNSKKQTRSRSSTRSKSPSRSQTVSKSPSRVRFQAPKKKKNAKIFNQVKSATGMTPTAAELKRAKKVVSVEQKLVADGLEIHEPTFTAYGACGSFRACCEFYMLSYAPSQHGSVDLPYNYPTMLAYLMYLFVSFFSPSGVLKNSLLSVSPQNAVASTSFPLDQLIPPQDDTVVPNFVAQWVLAHLPYKHTIYRINKDLQWFFPTTWSTNFSSSDLTPATGRWGLNSSDWGSTVYPQYSLHPTNVEDMTYPERCGVQGSVYAPSTLSFSSFWQGTATVTANSIRNSMNSYFSLIGPSITVAELRAICKRNAYCTPHCESYTTNYWSQPLAGTTSNIVPDCWGVDEFDPNLAIYFSGLLPQASPFSNGETSQTFFGPKKRNPTDASDYQREWQQRPGALFNYIPATHIAHFTSLLSTTGVSGRGALFDIKNHNLFPGITDTTPRIQHVSSHGYEQSIWAIFTRINTVTNDNTLFPFLECMTNLNCYYRMAFYAALVNKSFGCGSWIYDYTAPNLYNMIDPEYLNAVVPPNLAVIIGAIGPYIDAYGRFVIPANVSTYGTQHRYGGGLLTYNTPSYSGLPTTPVGTNWGSSLGFSGAGPTARAPGTNAMNSPTWYDNILGLTASWSNTLGINTNIWIDNLPVGGSSTYTTNFVFTNSYRLGYTNNSTGWVIPSNSSYLTLFWYPGNVTGTLTSARFPLGTTWMLTTVLQQYANTLENVFRNNIIPSSGRWGSCVHEFTHQYAGQINSTGAANSMSLAQFTINDNQSPPNYIGPFSVPQISTITANYSMGKALQAYAKLALIHDDGDYWSGVPGGFLSQFPVQYSRVTTTALTSFLNQVINADTAAGSYSNAFAEQMCVWEKRGYGSAESAYFATLTLAKAYMGRADENDKMAGGHVKIDYKRMSKIIPLNSVPTPVELGRILVVVLISSIPFCKLLLQLGLRLVVLGGQLLMVLALWSMTLSAHQKANTIRLFPPFRY